MFQLTILIDDASMLRNVGTVYEVMIAGGESVNCTDLLAATDWFLVSLHDGIGSHIEYFDAAELATFVRYLRRTADMIEGFAEIANGEEA